MDQHTPTENVTTENVSTENVSTDTRLATEEQASAMTEESGQADLASPSVAKNAHGSEALGADPHPTNVSSPRQAAGLGQFIPPIAWRLPGFMKQSVQDVATLFIDVAGFTSLSEALSSLGAEGAEILEHTIARYFDALLDVIERWNGLPIKISGDALTVVFPSFDSPVSDAVLAALGCASELRTAALSVATVKLPGQEKLLAHKIGLGVGSLLHGEVGDPRLRRELIFAGSALERAVQAEHVAKAGQVWLCPEAAACVTEASWLHPRDADGFARLHDDAEPEQVLKPHPSPGFLPAPSEEALRETFERFVPPAVREHAAQGTLNYITRHQHLTVLFAGCPTLKLERPDQLENLDAHYRQMQQVVEQFGGFLSEFEAGDKGSKLIVFFGAPTMLEDPCGQAARCALAMQQVAKNAGILADQRIGMTTGRLYVGRIGCRSLVKYSALGDRMNLAARLMSAAARWTVLAEKMTAERSMQDTRWGALRTLKVKGKNEPIVVTSLQRRSPRRQKRGRGILGRKAEQAVLQKFFESVKSSRGGVFRLVGEAGIGKTRLLEYLRRLAREQGPLPVVTWNGAQVFSAPPFAGWRPLLAHLMGLEARQSAVQRLAAFQLWHDGLPEEMRPPATLLAALMEVPFPPDPVHARLSADQLYTFRLRALVETLLYTCKNTPILLILDSAERLDTASIQVLQELSTPLLHLPLGIVAAHRSADQAEADPFAGLRDRPGARLLELGPLPERDATRLIARTLKVKLVDPELVAYFQDRTHRNPLLIEAWIETLRDHGHIRILQGGAFLRSTHRMAELPDRFEALILSQLERLPGEVRLSLLVASVMGFSFTPADVAAIHPESPGEAGVANHLRLAAQTSLLWYDRERPGHLLFSRPEIKEALHDSLPFHLRRQLHKREAARIEIRLKKQPSAELALALATHYEYSEDPIEQQEPFYQATLVCRDRYDHRGTVRWGRRFLEVVKRVPLDAVSNPKLGAERVMAIRMQVSQALSKMGDSDERSAFLQSWVDEAHSADDTRGLAIALQQQGMTLFRMGQKANSLVVLEESLLAAQVLADLRMQAESLINIAMAYGESGQSLEALKALEQAIERAPKDDIDLRMRSASNRGFILNQLNRPQEALLSFREALELSEELGDFWAQAVLVGNVGIELWSMGLPDQAHSTLLRALELKRRVGDRRELALSLSNVGFSFLRLGDLVRARAHTEEARTIFARMHYPRGEIYAVSNLGEICWMLGQFEEAKECYSRGQVLLDANPHAYLAIELTLRQGELALSLEHLDEAETLFQSALSRCTSPDRLVLRCNALEGLAETCLKLHVLERARQAADEVLQQLPEVVEGVSFPQRIWWRCSRVFHAQGELSRASELARQALGRIEQEQLRFQDAASRMRVGKASPWNREILAHFKRRRVTSVHEVRPPEGAVGPGTPVQET